MDLPVMPPVRPMLAKSLAEIPEPDAAPGGLLYEPKWDGFRCVLFRDGDEVELGSRNERPLTRYFPEIVAAALERLPSRVVLDGELVVATADRLDFDVLQNRLHPADSRVRRLAAETPAAYVVFDVLALDDRSLVDAALRDRRAVLLETVGPAGAPFPVTPATTDPDVARRWFDQFEGAGLDGLVAKPLEGRYEQDKRAMFKVKHERTADCVVAGFRWHKSGDVVGSLLLGLYDANGALQHVGVSASFPMATRRALVDTLAPYRVAEDAEHPWGGWAAPSEGRRPGGLSRWSAGKDLSFVPLSPTLVCEVAYDHLEGDRFRHTTRFRRWRPDRDPRSCTYAQLETPVRYDLAEVLRGAHG